jgi:hypothetical protein
MKIADIVLLVGVAVPLLGYYVGRKWLLAHIVATLAAGAKADPFRAEYVRNLIKERDRIAAERLEPAAIASEQLSAALEKRAQEVEDSIADAEPSCSAGRRLLFEEARDILNEAR